jgi:branched-chain amino acid transport system substrate-binding protein
MLQGNYKKIFKEIIKAIKEKGRRWRNGEKVRDFFKKYFLSPSLPLPHFSLIFFVFMLALILIYSSCKKEEKKSEIELRMEQREKEWSESGKKIATREDREKVSAEVDFEKKGDKEISLESERKMKVGVLGAETGELSEYGLKTLIGAQLAAEEINASGGINGEPLEVLHYNTSGSIAETLNAVDKFISEGVAAIIGSPTGEVTFSASKKLNDHQTILISAGTRRRIGDTGPYMFRNTLSDDDAVNELIDYCINKANIKNFALISSMSNDYSITLTALFKKAILINSGGNVVEDVFLWSENTANIAKEDSSIEFQVGKIKSKSPDAVVYTGDPLEGIKIAKEIRRQGIKSPLIGGEELITENFIKDGKDAIIGTIVYSGFYGDSKLPHIKGFVDSYKKKYGTYPDRIAALGYDALNMIAEAIRKAPSMRPTHIRDSLAGIKDFSGVTGMTSFTANKEVKKHAYILEAKKEEGRIKFVLVGGEG